MKYFLFSICLFFSQVLSAHGNSISSTTEFDYGNVVAYRIIDQSEACTIIELEDENGVVLLNVIAAVATVFLPETVDAVCQRTVGDPVICNTVYDITSVLVDITGAGIYKKVVRGMKWLANRGRRRSMAVIETNSYEIASGLKQVFFSYRENCELGSGIPWENVDYEEASDVINQLEAKSVVVELFNSWENLNLGNYLDLWDENAVQYTNRDSRYFSELRDQRTSLFRRLQSVNVLNYEIELDRINATEARVNVVYSMRFEFNNGKIINETNVEEMYILKYDSVRSKWLIYKNYDYINK